MKVSIIPDARISFYFLGYRIWVLDMHNTSTATFMKEPEKLGDYLKGLWKR